MGRNYSVFRFANVFRHVSDHFDSVVVVKLLSNFIKVFLVLVNSFLKDFFVRNLLRFFYDFIP